MKELLPDLMPFRRLTGLSPWDFFLLAFSKLYLIVVKYENFLVSFQGLQLLYQQCFRWYLLAMMLRSQLLAVGVVQSLKETLFVSLFLVLKQQTVFQVILTTLIETFDLANVLHWFQGWWNEKISSESHISVNQVQEQRFHDRPRADNAQTIFFHN